MAMRRALTNLLFVLAAAGVTLFGSTIFLGQQDIEKTLRTFLGSAAPVGEALPPAPPGSPLVITLSDVPRTDYGVGPSGPNERRFRRLAEDHGFEYRRSLSQAARELAVFYGDYRRLAPSSALGFILESSGAPYWGVRQAVVITNAPGDAPIETLLGESHKEGDVVGLGEATLAEEPPQRIIVALTAYETLALDPLPRVFVPGRAGTISGRLAPGYTSPKAIAMGPDSEFVELKTTTTGRRFTIVRPSAAGKWVVEILAVGPHGPVPLTQLTLYGDEAIPTVFESTWPPALDAATDSAEYVAGLVNSARADAQIPPLAYDEALAHVAMSHSKDMQTGDFVGHRSPRTGLLSDRLRGAGYRSVSRGENVALNVSLYDAHVGLMWSLGHRKNILSTQFTHFGVGVRKGERGWYVTEVFAHPTPVLDDPGAAADELLEALRRAREASSETDAVVRRDATLSRIAREAAKGTWDSPEDIVEAVRDQGVRTRTTVWTGQLALLDQFNAPRQVIDGTYTRFGVGVHQDLDTAGPSVRVVLIAAEGR